jgi:ankyrin repeat protein
MDNVDLVRKLMQQGAPVNFADHTEGWTPLHHAVRHHSIGVVELLLRSEADPTHQNVKGRNCLHFAARHDVPDAIRAVMKFVELPVSSVSSHCLNVEVVGSNAHLVWPPV